MEFEPKLIGFLCKWCSSAGADLAGVSRKSYPPNLVPITVNCSGRIDVSQIVKAFKDGADGVLVSGCHPGDCHYTSGNYKTWRRVALLKHVLDDFGLDPDRVRLEWISATEGEKFAQTVEDFTAEIKELGPGPFRDVKK
ncbi:hydrogenase iron-sulfur subunit [Candidatus Bipolaricaulota bacterium]|nr:hydrogenase iron-sulfur subunit [Candidatus Bipolaricaulota bacterium]